MPRGAARLAVVVLALAAGIVIIAKGFRVPSASGTPPPSPSSSPTATPTGHHSQTPSTPTGSPTPRQQGVVLAVFNAAGTLHLAGDTQTKLQQAGYAVPLIGDFARSTTTTIYYRDAQGKLDGGLLKQKYVHEGVLKPITAAEVKNMSTAIGAKIPNRVELIVILGTDYAATHPAGG